MDRNILARNNVRIVGQGSEPMLLAHGFGCDQTMWRFVAPAFEATHKVVLFDFVGCGKSDARAYNARRYASLDGYARDVIEVCRAAELNDKVIFVGHSVSSIIGVLAAKMQPDLFKQLILIGPSPRYINDPPDYRGGFERAEIEGLLDLMEKNYLGWASFLAPVVMKNAERPELKDELQQSFCAMDPKIARRFAEVTFMSDNRADLADVRVPALVMQCSDDAIAPEAVGEFTKERLPHSSLRLLEATGHCPHLSHPAETISVIKEYLASATAG
jgi:sigma-B regulation protein RsbQ